MGDWIVALIPFIIFAPIFIMWAIASYLDKHQIPRGINKKRKIVGKKRETRKERKERVRKEINEAFDREWKYRLGFSMDDIPDVFELKKEDRTIIEFDSLEDIKDYVEKIKHKDIKDLIKEQGFIIFKRPLDLDHFALTNSTKSYVIINIYSLAHGNKAITYRNYILANAYYYILLDKNLYYEKNSFLATEDIDQLQMSDLFAYQYCKKRNYKIPENISKILERLEK